MKKLCKISLTKPVPTRWNSYYDAICCLLKFENILDDICDATGTVKFKPSEVEFLKEYQQCTKPIAWALDKMQADDFFGVMLPILRDTERRLKSLQSKSWKHCGQLPDLLQQFLYKRFGSLIDLSIQDHADAIVASISHPKYKLRWIPEAQMEGLKNFFVDTVMTEWRNAGKEERETETASRQPGTSTTKLVNDAEENEDEIQFERGFGAKSILPAEEQQIMQEIENYLESDLEDVSMLFRFPSVKLVFMKFNAPMPSSAAVERFFSYVGMILSPRRQNMTDDHVEQHALLKVNDMW